MSAIAVNNSGDMTGLVLDWAQNAGVTVDCLSVCDN